MNEESFLELFNSDITSNESGSNRGEDFTIKEILNLVSSLDTNNEARWCVEIGAWDGQLGSNTAPFIQNHNFSAVLVEGDPEKFRTLKSNYEGKVNVHPLNSYVGKSPENQIDALLSQTSIPQDFEFLSIDIDGNDYHVWKNLNQYKPKLVIIEFNPTIPNEVDFYQEDDFTLNQGSSVKALTRLANEKGYQLVGCNLNNAFFVRDDLYSKIPLNDNSISRLRMDKSRVTYIFNGYDGTIFIRGFGKVDLLNYEYNEKKMQVLPKYLRGYSDGPIKLNPIQRILRRTVKSFKKRYPF